MRPKTQQAGAALERQAWNSKLRRMIRIRNSGGYSVGYTEAIEELQKFSEGRTKRDDAAAGGLGKKRRTK